MKKIISAALFSFLMLIPPASALADERVKAGGKLTITQCVEIALKNNPSVLSYAYSSSASENRVHQARSSYYPEIDVTSSYAKNFIDPGASTTSSSTYNSYTTSAKLTQTIYNFGKTGINVDVQEKGLDASRFDLENIKDTVVFNVKKAYYGLLQAERDVIAAKENLRQAESHLLQARGFYEAGSKPKFDVTKAEVDLGNAKLNRIKTENAVRSAVVTLNNAMGTPNATGYTVEDTLDARKFTATLTDAINEAYRNRPDLKSALAKEAAASRSIDLSERGYYPSLTGNAAYTWSGQDFPMDRGWNVGATITIPIFSGFLTKYQVAEAKDNLGAARASELSVKQGILFDVQQAYIDIKNAEEQIDTTAITVRQATENLELANGRYAAGVGNPIEVTDAEAALTSAKTSYNQALYNYNVALASIEKATGARK